MAVLISSKISSPRERVDMNAILDHAKAGRYASDGGKAGAVLEFGDGERNFKLSLTAEETRTALAGWLGVDVRVVAALFEGVKP